MSDQRGLEVFGALKHIHHAFGLFGMSGVGRSTLSQMLWFAPEYEVSLCKIGFICSIPGS